MPLYLTSSQFALELLERKRTASAVHSKIRIDDAEMGGFIKLVNAVINALLGNFCLRFNAKVWVGEGDYLKKARYQAV